MKNIVLQAGHINAKNNSRLELRGNTGAPGEQELNQRITDRVASLLRLKGFFVVQTDACANDNKIITSKNWDLFLAIHGDADNPNSSGGTVGVCEPTLDQARVESQRIKEAISATYFRHAEITDLKFTSMNILRYYMWKYLSAKTPCVLIELGQVQDPHDKVLLADTNRIGIALARAVCNAFGVVYDAVQVPVDSKNKVISDLKLEILGLKADLAVANQAIVTAKNEGEVRVAETKSECQRKDGFLLVKLKELEALLV